MRAFFEIINIFFSKVSNFHYTSPIPAQERILYEYVSNQKYMEECNMTLYSEKEKTLVSKMVKEFSLVHNHKKRLELVWWYSFATGIKDDVKTEAIMKDLGAI